MSRTIADSLIHFCDLTFQALTMLLKTDQCEFKQLIVRNRHP